MFGTMQDVPLTMGRLLRHGVVRHSRSTVVSFDDALDPVVLHFGELGERCAALAHGLADLGVGPGDVVGTLAGNTGEHLETQLAVPAMGAVVHPANVLLRPEQLVETVRRAGDTVLLADSRWTELAASVAREVPAIRHVVVAGTSAPGLDVPGHVTVHAHEQLLDGRLTAYDWPEPDERTAAAILFTSGTTGEPKGVAFSHRSIWLHSMQMCMAESANLSDADTVLSAVPLSHVLSWGLPHASLLSGASLVLARSRPGEPSPAGADVAALLARHRPTKGAATPTVCLALLRHLEAHPQDLSHLGELLVGGSPMPPAMFDEFDQRHGVRLLQAWGMTESGPLGTVARPSAHASATTRRAQSLGQGRFPAAVDARVVDPQGEPDPAADSVGELEIRGPWVTARYLDDAGGASGAEHFHDGWLRTGDLASISRDGFLTLTDRSDDAILSGGEWISSVELENEVMRDPRVAEAACIGVPDPRWGTRPLVLVILKDGVDAEARSLWSALAGSVELWKRPDHWAFVDAIPRTSVGKFDKRAIRARAADGGYEIVTVESHH